MAGLRGNVAAVSFAKQTAKGSVAATPVDRLPFSGGSIAPSRSVDNLSETDATRNQGVSYVQQTAVEGSPEVYVRDANIHHVLEGVLGARATSGATNYTHTLTPSIALPYYTFWREIDGTLWERFEDVMFSEVTISADTASPLTAAMSVVGRKAVQLTSDPTSGWPAVASGAVYNYNEATVTLSGGATSLIGSFECTITNNVTLQQTDDSQPYDVVPGMFEVTLGFDLIFETLTEYKNFHYAGGTAQSNAIYTTSAVFDFVKSANNAVTFTFPANGIAFEEFPVDPDAGGAPIVVPVRARAQRSASPFVTAVVKNQVSS
jgi:hypothetical protein